MAAEPKPTEAELLNYYQGFLFGAPKDPDRKAREAVAACSRILNDLASVGIQLSGKRLLDYGGGVGFHANGFASLGLEATLTDPDVEACEYARRRFPRVTTVPMECLDGGVGYDIVFANQVIEHALDLNDFVSRMRSLLRPGGTLIVTTPNQGALEFLFRPMWLAYYISRVSGKNLLKIPLAVTAFLRHPWICCDPPRHIFSLNRVNLTRLLENHGFKVQYCATLYSFCDHYGLRDRVSWDRLASPGLRILYKADAHLAWGDNLVAFATFPQ